MRYPYCNSRIGRQEIDPEATSAVEKLELQTEAA